MKWLPEIARSVLYAGVGSFMSWKDLIYGTICLGSDINCKHTHRQKLSSMENILAFTLREKENNNNKYSALKINEKESYTVTYFY